MCMNILSVCMLHTVHTVPKEGSRFFGARVQDRCELPCRC